MEQLKSVVDILRVLDRSNCKKCREATCTVFAAKVLANQRKLSDCPNLAPEVLRRFGEMGQTGPRLENNARNVLDELKGRVRGLDLAGRAKDLGGVFDSGKLCLKIMGKDFCVDSQGRLSSGIHVNPWVATPFLDYVINGQGVKPTGVWVGFRELKDGPDLQDIFRKQCEQAMRRLADSSPDFFRDLLEMFSGDQVENHLNSDTSIVLWPLPRVPLLLCHWEGEEEIESDLLLFFDATVNQNLSTESVFTMGTGLAVMFEKLALRHG